MASTAMAKQQNMKIMFAQWSTMKTRGVPACVQINRWFGTSRPNF